MPHTPSTQPLWLAVQCPHLALDLAIRGLATGQDRAVAVSDGDPRRPRILDANAAARRRGIRPGLSTSAGRALADDLHLADRAPASERAALERMAACAYRYSSLVALQPDRHAVLLEVSGSSRLFGSPRHIAEALSRTLSQLGYQARTGSGPTPESAQLAAPQGLHIEAGERIGRRLGDFALTQLPLDAGQAKALERMGFRSLGEVLRLPRKALSRRSGPALVDYLDRLTGARPDPLVPWRPPVRFSSGLELVAETASHQALLFPLRRLVDELCDVLQACDRGAQALSFELHHAQGCASLRLGLQRPGRDPAHLMLLLRERLERLKLPGPVRRLGLEVEHLLPFDARQENLFAAEDPAQAAVLAPWLERLQARLGAQAVQGLRGIEDHRPERSWAVRELGEPADCTALTHRPVWLLAQPQACQVADYQLLAGPERIETGWWDGHDCRRDYFVARDVAGRTLWLFHEYKPRPGWYLQGLFA